ncbi:hypothetical protein MY3296_003167 [Beauveria thailandica]
MSTLLEYKHVSNALLCRWRVCDLSRSAGAYILLYRLSFKKGTKIILNKTKGVLNKK